MTIVTRKVALPFLLWASLLSAAATGGGDRETPRGRDGAGPGAAPRRRPHRRARGAPPDAAETPRRHDGRARDADPGDARRRQERRNGARPEAHERGERLLLATANMQLRLDFADGDSCDGGSQCTSGICINARCSSPLADGERCSDPTHCASTFCAGGSCSSGADGQTCDASVACAAGLVCINPKCVPLFPDGTYCDDGTHCESTFCAMRSCSSGAEGQTCDAAVACAAGLICVGSRCIAPLEDGKYCSDPTHCASTFCVLGACFSGAEGQACSPADVCAADSPVCINSRCSALLEDGKYCNDPTHCASTFCIQGFCTAGLVDQLCLEAEACATEDLYCLNNKCAAKLADGLSCAGANERCLSGICLPGPGTSYCSTATGVGDIPDGEYCAEDGQCLSLVCLDSQCSAPLPDLSPCALGAHCESTFCAAGFCSSGALDQTCSDEVACSADVCIDSVCSALLLDEEGCSDPSHCASALCVEGSCFTGAEGQACSPADACAADFPLCLDFRCSALFPDGTYCDDATHCVSTFCAARYCSSGAEGQTCDAAVACAAGLVCVGNKCIAPLEDGKYCSDPTHCVSALCVQGFCFSGAAGQYCTATDTCAADAPACINAKCSALLADGKYCSDPTNCESGTCDTGFCGVPFWMMTRMIHTHDGDAGTGGVEAFSGFSGVPEDAVASRDIRFGFFYELPSFAEETPPGDAPSRARWIVHRALWATVSAGEGYAAGNPRSSTDGAAPGSSSGLPVFNVPDVDATAGILEASGTAVALSFGEKGACGGTCAEVVLYGKAVQLVEYSAEFRAALASFKATHPMAEWLWKGGSHVASKYYTVAPTSIVIRASPEAAAVSVGVTEYLSVAFEADREGGSEAHALPKGEEDPNGSAASWPASWPRTYRSAASRPRSTTMDMIAGLVMAHAVAF